MMAFPCMLFRSTVITFKMYIFVCHKLFFSNIKIILPGAQIFFKRKIAWKKQIFTPVVNLFKFMYFKRACSTQMFSLSSYILYPVNDYVNLYLIKEIKYFKKALEA